MKKIITLCIIGLSILILNSIPLFFYANSGILRVDSIDFQYSGYAGYYPLFFPFPFNLLFGNTQSLSDFVSPLGIFFGIGTLPLFFLSPSSWKKRILWIFACFLGFNVALGIGGLTGAIISFTGGMIIGSANWEIIQQIFGSDGVFLVVISSIVGIEVSTILLLKEYQKLSGLVFHLSDFLIFAFLGCGIFLMGIFSLHGLTFLGTWGTTPAIRMYVIFLWHICMSFLLFIFVLRRFSISSSENHIQIK